MPWTPAELAVADELTLTDDEVAQLLGRSERAVRVKRWRRADPVRAEAYAKEYYQQNRDRILRQAVLYDRTHRQQIRQAARLVDAAQRGQATRHGEKYEQWEDELILTGELPPRELAARMGRTMTSVRQRRRKLRERQDGR